MIERREISCLVRSVMLILFSAASSWAVDVDMPISATADCLKNNYMSLDLKYHHGPAKCHKTEGIWTGDFLNTSQAEVCRPPEPLSTSIGQCNNTCCYICGGNDETHRNPLNNFAKPAIPGVYRQSISLTSLEEGKSITADVRVVFTPDGLGGLPVCASAQTAVNIPSEGSESANFIITIPDEGQTNRLIKDAATDGQEALVGQTATLRAQVIRSVRANGETTGEGIQGVLVIFTPKDPAGAQIGSPITKTTGPDGSVSFDLTLNQGAGTYTIGAACSACAAGNTQSFTAIARQVETIFEILPGVEGGNGQRQLKGSVLEPLRVRVKDTDGTLKSGVTVNFSEVNTPTPGSFSDPNPVTDEKGIATTIYHLGNQEGIYQLRAVCSICASASGPQGATIQGAIGPSATGTVQELLFHEDARTLKEHPPIKQEETPADRGHCAAEIVQITPGPDGRDSTRPPNKLLTCTGLQPDKTHLRCQPRGDANRFSSFTCDQWFLHPLIDADGSGLNILSTPSNERYFFSSFAQDFLVQANFSAQIPGEAIARTCVPERTISVGNLELLEVTVDAGGFSRPFNGGPRSARLLAKLGSRINVSDIRDFIAVASPDSGHFLNVDKTIYSQSPDQVLITIQLKEFPGSTPVSIHITVSACISVKPDTILVATDIP